MGGLFVLGGGTLLAAVFGLLFQSLLAYYFGAGAETDAWFMSLSIYAFLGKFLMLTHLKSIALPVYRRLETRDAEAGRRLARRLLLWSGGGLAALAALLVVAGPLLVDLLAPGYEGQTRDLTVALVRIRIPALVFLGTTAAGLVVLESRDRFGVSVMGQKVVPAVLTLLLLAGLGDRYGMVSVGWMGLAGGVAGGLVVLAALRSGLRRPRAHPADEAGGRTSTAGLLAPAPSPGPEGGPSDDPLRAIGGQWLKFSGSNAATFVGEWAFRVAASLLPVGLFSAVLYGRMVHDLLHGAVNDAAQTVSLPRFARAGEGGGHAVSEVGTALRASMAGLWAVAVPLAAFAAFSAGWIVALLFGRGAFLADGMVAPAAVALRIFLVGFVLQGLVQLLFAASFATDRSHLVNRVQIVGHLVRAALLVPAVWLFSYAGLVGAQVAMNALVLLLLLGVAPAEWRLGWAGIPDALRGVPGRTAVATALLALAHTGTAAALPDPLALGTVGRGLVLAGLAGGWAVGYGILGGILGITPVQAGLRRLRRAAAAACIAGAILVGGTPALLHAQAPVSTGPDTVGAMWTLLAPTLLPADHWSLTAVELLQARGAVPMSVTRGGPRSARALARALAGGLSVPVGSGPPPEDSSPAGRPRPVTPPGALATAALHQLAVERGTPEGWAVRAGMGWRTRPRGSEAPTGVVVASELLLGKPDGRVHGRIQAEAGPGDSGARLVAGALTLGLGRMALRVGRHRVQLGGGAGGSLVLSPAAPLDGVLLTTEEAWNVPVVGPTFVTAGVFSLHRYRGVVEDPWFALLRAEAVPAPWVALGVSRAAQVGGHFKGGTPPFQTIEHPADSVGMSAADVLGILVGRVTGYDNQIWSADARVSLAQLGAPLLLHGEVALEDNARSFGDGAFQAGALLDLPLGGIHAALRYEYTGVGDPGRWCRVCDTLPAFWYQHTRFQEGWRAGPDLLGHPLGGYGLQHLVRGTVWSPGGGVRLDAGVTRTRRDRWNLLKEERPGWAWGGHTALRADLRRGVRLVWDGEVEWGDTGWRSGSTEVRLEVSWAGPP